MWMKPLRIVTVAVSVAVFPPPLSCTVKVQLPGVAPVELYVTCTGVVVVGPIVIGLAGPLLGVVVLVKVPPQFVLKVQV
jgi:hypothetical protein